VFRKNECHKLFASGGHARRKARKASFRFHSDQARLQLSREGEHATSQQFILQNDRTISTNALKF